MLPALIAPLIATTGRKIATGAITAAVLMAAGAAAWDRTPIIGPHAKITALRAQIDEPVTGYRARLAASTAYGVNREKARASCEAARQGEAKDRADDISEAAQRNSLAASGAFDQGYAAGRAAGRKSCASTPVDTRPGGASAHVPNGTDPIGDLIARSLQDDAGDDLARSFNSAAYQPGAPLSR